MTTVTGSVRSLISTASPGAKLRWKYKSAPALVGGGLVSSYKDVVTTCNLIGDFSQALTGGDYEVTIDGFDSDKFIVAVPSDDLTYDIADLIESDLTQVPEPPTPAVIPNASTTVAGKVKTVLDGANIKVATGIWIKSNVAAVKALASDASNQLVFLTAPEPGEPRIVYYDPLSSAADDPTGFSVIKPTDNPVTGRWIPFSF